MTAKQQGPRMVVGISVWCCVHIACTRLLPSLLHYQDVSVCVCVCVCASLTSTVFDPRKQFLDVRLHTCRHMAGGGGGEACNHGHIREQA